MSEIGLNIVMVLITASIIAIFVELILLSKYLFKKIKNRKKGVKSK